MEVVLGTGPDQSFSIIFYVKMTCIMIDNVKLNIGIFRTLYVNSFLPSTLRTNQSNIKFQWNICLYTELNNCHHHHPLAHAWHITFRFQPDTRTFDCIVYLY